MNRAAAAGGDPQQALQHAVADYQAGRYRQARKILKPLRRMPDPDGYVTLLSGLVEAELGEWKRARALLRDAVKLLPKRVEGWMGLGNAERVLRNAREAIAAYKRALELQPGLAGGWNNLGLAYADLGHEHDALRSFERALHCNPGYKEAAQSRAEALVRLTRFEDARSAYRELMQKYPEDGEIALACAETLEKANRPEHACEVLPDRDILEGPEVIARREILRARLLARENRLEEALEVVQSARRDTGVECTGYFEGNLLDRAGHYDAAMDAFTRANRERAGQWSFRRFRDQQLIEFVEHKISTGIEPPEAVDPATEYRTPVFITGLPRSGTTLLDRILDAHPDVQILEEPESLHVLQAAISRGATPAQARERYWEYIEGTIGIDPDLMVVDKNPFHAFHLDLLPGVFPQAHVIYSLRHPYDSALSCFMQDFAPNPATIHFLDMVSTARLCAGSLEMMRIYEQACAKRVHRVYYERLVSGDLRTGLEPLLAALGLQWHPDMERFAEKASRSGLIKTASYEQVTRGLYTSAVERWRNYQQWLGPFREQLGPLLEYWGYEADS